MTWRRIQKFVYRNSWLSEFAQYYVDVISDLGAFVSGSVRVVTCYLRDASTEISRPAAAALAKGFVHMTVNITDICFICR